MMHLVPSCSPVPSSTFDASQLEFDLDLLPVSLGPDCVVPGSPGQYSLCSPLDTHTTMFSPEPPAGPGLKRSGQAMPPSPGPSLSPLSPYSPASRPERRVSTQSAHSVSSGDAASGINLQESLMEFTQLQDKIKLEQDLLLDPHSSLQLSPGYPSHHRYSVSSESSAVFPLSPEPSLAQDLVPVKMEPLDIGFQNSKAASNTLLKQCLSDTSFQAKYNLKPADFGITTGFVSSDTATNQSGDQSPVTSSVKTELTPEATTSGHKPLGPTLSDTVKIEPLLDLAADQVRREIAATCQMLTISPSKYLFQRLLRTIFISLVERNLLFSKPFDNLCSYSSS